MIFIRIFVLIVLNIIGAPVYSWQYFTKFRDLIMQGTHPEEVSVHSEYYFGDCKRDGIVYYTSIYILNIEIEQKLIMRGWLPLQRIPTCIVLRAYSTPEHMYRTTAFEFQMCVPRISYCHSQKQFKHYYYEWYLPEDYTGGMDWDIIFYGPPSLAWQ